MTTTVENTDQFLERCSTDQLEAITAAHEEWETTAVVPHLLQQFEPPPPSRSDSLGLWRNQLCQSAWRHLAKRYKAQLDLLPKKGRSVVQGFISGANEGSRPGPVTAPPVPDDAWVQFARDAFKEGPTVPVTRAGRPALFEREGEVPPLFERSGGAHQEQARGVFGGPRQPRIDPDVIDIDPAE